ncbi:MAG: heme-binding protein [Pseudomonadota bacterium]
MKASFLTLVLITAWYSTTVLAVGQKPFLTLDMAKKMADTCEAKAIAEGWRKVNISIYDEGGNLKLFRRQDGAFMHSIQISQLKARTSAGLPRSTRQLGDIAYKDPDKPHGLELVPDFVVFPGGLPILMEDGTQIGGIGVSGATGDQDEACAQAAIDAVKDQLQ